MTVYYNEHDPRAAQWLRVLSCCGEISPGDVDARDVQQVRAEDLVGRTKAHFFAGIGGWDYALRLAGWPAGRDVWTASLPCQPFSQAGQQRGTDDDRHLWPVFRDLVEQCLPPVIFGEQVASKPGRAWLASVQADLEALGYSTAAADLCAAGVGAPHIRQRLYWGAIRQQGQLPGRDSAGAVGPTEGCDGRLQHALCRDAGGLGISDSAGREQGRTPAKAARHGDSVEPAGGAGGLGNPGVERRQQDPGGSPAHEATHGGAGRDGREQDGDNIACGAGKGNGSGLADSDGSGSLDGVNSEKRRRSTAITKYCRNIWADVVYLPCADGKARPIKPGIEPLVDGLPGRVGLLRGYGNAISPPLAAIFIQSVMEATQHG